MQLLVKMGANIGSMDNFGQTALFKAAESGQPAVVRLLLQNGTDVQTESYNMYSPLDAAVRGGRLAIVQLLLGNTANTAVTHKYATIALFKAAPAGLSEAFQLLVDHCRKIGVPEEVVQSTRRVQTGSLIRKICDYCEAGILGTDIYYHCETCNLSDFDLC